MPRAAFVLACGISALFLAASIANPIPTFFWSLCFAVVAWRIRRKDRWAALGAGSLLAATSLEPFLRQVSWGTSDLPPFLVLWGTLVRAVWSAPFFLAAPSLVADSKSRNWLWTLPAVIHIGYTLLLAPFVIPSGSMEDTLLIGDRILARRVFGAEVLGHGQVVLFRPPGRQGTLFVMRIVGKAGDRLRLLDKKLFRNGSEVAEPSARHKLRYVDPYRDNFPATPNFSLDAAWLELLEKQTVDGEFVVPAGTVFVMGDNRDNSLDSRYLGPIPIRDVIGTPICTTFSAEAPDGEPDDVFQGFDPTRIRWERWMRPIR